MKAINCAYRSRLLSAWMGTAFFLWVLCGAQLRASQEITVHLDSGSKVISDLGISLSAGSAAKGDGCVLELGYYNQATLANKFLGQWVALSGQGSANTEFTSSSIGDNPLKGAGAGAFALSLTFVEGSASSGNNLPSAGTPLAIRFYNASTIASSTAFNVVACDQWLWQAPSLAPNHPILTLSLDDANLSWLGGNSSALTTSEARPGGRIAFSAASQALSSAGTNNLPNELLVALTRDVGSTGPVSVAVSVTGGTLSINDFSLSTSLVNFADGVSSAIAHILLGSTQLSGSIELTLSSPIGAILGSQKSTTLQITSAGVIAPGTISFGSATYQKLKPSGATTLTISARRRGGSSGTVSADVVVTGGSAIANTDFTLPGTQLSWSAGDTADKSFDLTIPAGADLGVTGKSVVLEMQSFSGLSTAGAPSSTTVTLLNADALVPKLTLVTPGANATVTASAVTLTGHATDNTYVARVEVILNGRPIQNASLIGTSSVNWSLDLIPEQGVNSVKVTAYDPQGNASIPIARSFTFNYLRPGLAGSYNGLLVPGPDSSSPSDHHGLLSLQVGTTGKFTGKVRLSGGVVALRGFFNSDGNAVFGSHKDAAILLTKGSGLAKVSLGYLSLKLDPSGISSVAGSLGNAEKTATYSNVLADRAIYSSARKLPANMLRLPSDILDPKKDNGRYTSVLASKVDQGLATNNGLDKGAYPQSDGYGIVKVSASGSIKIVGKLADGSAFTYSNQLSGNNQWPVFIPLYANKGYLCGNVQFDSLQPLTDAACFGMKWYRPAGYPLYPAGWPNSITLDFKASKFIPTGKPTTSRPVPPNPNTMFGTTLLGVDAPATNLSITLTDGGLTSVLGNDASLNAHNECSIGEPTTGLTGAPALSVAFLNASGAFTGSFTHPISSKKLALSGVVFQKTVTASGFFLYVPLPNAVTSPNPESGSVKMTPK